MRIEWTTLAAADIRHIFEYISHDDRDAAVRAVAHIRSSIRGQLIAAPFSGRTGRVTGTREYIVPRLPYLVVYRVTEDSLQILRILHDEQQWPMSRHT